MLLVWVGFQWRRGKGARAYNWTYATVAAGLWNRKSHPFSILVFITYINVLGCLGIRPKLSLSLFDVILGCFLYPILLG